MIPVFASTTATIATEFVDCFPWPYLKLSNELSKIGVEKGVKFNMADKVFSVTGQWKELLSVYESLQNLLEVQMEVYGSEGNTKTAMECDNDSYNDSLDTEAQADKHSKRSPYRRYKRSIMTPSFGDTEGGIDGTSIVKTERLSGEAMASDCITDYTKLYDYSVSEGALANQCTSDAENMLSKKTENDEDKVHYEVNSTNSDDDKEESSSSCPEFPDAKKTVEDYLTLSCTQCDYVGSDESCLRDHVKQQHSTNVAPDLHCNLCNKYFPARPMLVAHVNSLHKLSSSSRSLKSKVKKLKIQLEPKKRGRLAKVKPVEKDGIFNCVQCSYVGRRAINLKEHVNRQHRAAKQACKTCGKLFGYNKDMRRHVEDVHGEPKYFCKDCNKRYKSKLGFDNHMETHSKDYVRPVRPPVYCEFCGKSCCSKQAHATHVMTVHKGIKPYLCQTCGKSFTQPQAYRMHMNAHAGIKPYTCNTCGKSFSYAKSLTDHIFIHDNTGQFTCEICAKTFKQRQSLLIHMSVHKEKKDHICKDCGKGFTQKQALLRHERLHTGIMPFVCGLCHRSFSDKSVIRRHLMLVHKKDKITWKENVIEKIPTDDDTHHKGEGSVHDDHDVHTSNVRYMDQQPTDVNGKKQETTAAMQFPDFRHEDVSNVIHFPEPDHSVRPPYKPFPWL